MGVTHIVRGSDHVTNTATQIQIMQSLGGVPPAFAHHSLLTGAQGEELSKRLGTLSLRDLRAAGVEPLALLSLMARLGSSQPVVLAGSHQEIVDGFDLSTFGAAPTKFDAEDLKPLTRSHLRGRSYASLADRIRGLGIPDQAAEGFWHAMREGVDVLADLAEWWKIAAEGAVAAVDPEDEEFIAVALELLPDDVWKPETWGTWTEAVKAATGRKGRALYRPLRRALTGRETGPEMAALMPFLRKPRMG
jgi:glutamyl-tRNA synthetase